MNNNFLKVFLAIFVFSMYLIGCRHSTSNSQINLHALPRHDTHPDTHDISDVINRYYDLVIKKDYADSYDLLSKDTQKAITRQIYIHRMKINYEKLIVPKKVTDIQVLGQQDNTAVVAFKLRAWISTEKANALQRAGQPDAKKGEYSFNEQFPLVQENGHWKIVRRNGKLVKHRSSTDWAVSGRSPTAARR